MESSFGPYEVLERVAQGSTGIVYRARHVELGREAAIKELNPEMLDVPGMRERLRAEAETLAQLSDPHVVEVFDYVEEEDRAWIAEEWVQGAPLGRILDSHGSLTPEQSVGVLRGAVTGLAHAHDRDLLHRDVSPSNILADLAGTSKLVDFGLAAPVGVQGVLGTPAYMSPEAALGQPLSKPSDVYSAAAVLYTLLSGRPPYAGSDVATTLRRHRSDPVPVLDGHGADLQDLLRRSMAKDPTQRPPDAGAFLAELEEAARRRFGATWLDRATIAGVVATVVGAPSAVAGAVGGTTAAAAPTVVVDVATIAVGGDGRAGTVSDPKVRVLRGRGRLGVVGAVAAVVLIGGSSAIFATTRGDDNRLRQLDAGPPAAFEGPSGSEESVPSTGEPDESEPVGSEPVDSDAVEPFRGTWEGKLRIVGPSASRSVDSAITIECETTCRIIDATFPFHSGSVDLDGDAFPVLRYFRAQEGSPCDENPFIYGLEAVFRFQRGRLVGEYYSPAVPRGGGLMRCGGGKSASWTGMAKGSRFVGTLSTGSGPSR